MCNSSDDSTISSSNILLRFRPIARARCAAAAAAERPHKSIMRRLNLDTGTMSIAIIAPIFIVLLLFGMSILFVLRRRRKRKLHRNSPTTSAVRQSLEEDIEAYRREREQQGGSSSVLAPGGVSQEDLEQQLRSSAAGDRSSMRESVLSMTSGVVNYSVDIESDNSQEFYLSPGAPRAPSWNDKRRSRNGPPGSRNSMGPPPRPNGGSALKHSISQIDEDEAENGSKRPVGGDTTPTGTTTPGTTLTPGTITATTTAASSVHHKLDVEEAGTQNIGPTAEDPLLSSEKEKDALLNSEKATGA